MSPIPLSLRRKIVIALDADQVAPAGGHDVTDPDSGEATTLSRYLSFKTVAWCKANLLRVNEDHVFLVTSLDPGSNAFDGGVLAAMWTSVYKDEDLRWDRMKEAEAALRRLAECLHAVGVSCTMEVLRGPPADTIPEYAKVHRAEILAVQEVERSGIAAAVSYGWTDLCAKRCPCPTVMVKTNDLPENIATALDPPIPTSTI